MDDDPAIGTGRSATLVLDREIGIGPDDVLSHPTTVPEYSNQFQARLVWLGEGLCCKHFAWL
jgi:bifunctional enzyme CysN/CysC